ncbi:MAG: hypothetical protein HC890_12915 [Chloroflexaceae bacterium]|nr:hypothetical protein [Chloroflexaceae bacterium]
MANLDELLAQLREEYQEKAAMPKPETAPVVPLPSPAMDSLLAEVKAEVEGRALPLSPPSPARPEVT